MENSWKSHVLSQRFFSITTLLKKYLITAHKKDILLFCRFFLSNSYKSICKALKENNQVKRTSHMAQSGEKTGFSSSVLFKAFDNYYFKVTERVYRALQKIQYIL